METTLIGRTYLLSKMVMPTEFQFSERSARIQHPTSSTLHKIISHCTRSPAPSTRSPARSIRSPYCTYQTTHRTLPPTNSQAPIPLFEPCTQKSCLRPRERLPLSFPQPLPPRSPVPSRSRDHTSTMIFPLAYPSPALVRLPRSLLRKRTTPLRRRTFLPLSE